MILPNDIHPYNSLYYNGAIIIKYLKSEKNIKILDLYNKIKKENSVTFPIFLLSIDFLYLINAISVSDNGEVFRCL